MGQADGFASRQQLYVDISVGEESVVSSNEGKHSSVLGESGIDRGIGEECQLLPLFAGWCSGRGGAPEEKCCGDCENENSSGGVVVGCPRLWFYRRRPFCRLLTLPGRYRVPVASAAVSYQP